MISKVVDSIASLIWGYANDNEDAKREFQKAVSDGLICNADNACTTLASYITDVKAKVAEVEEAKSKARDAYAQWDKFSLEHSIAAQSQVALGDARAISDPDVGADVEHMFAAAKKAYTDMLDTIAYLADYTAKNHILMEAFGIEMCFMLTHEPLNVADMAGVSCKTAIILGDDKFRREAAKCLLDSVDDTDDGDGDEDEDEEGV